MVQEFPEFPAGVLGSCRAPACAVVEKLLLVCCKVLLLPDCSRRLHPVYPTADTSSEALTFPSSSVMTAAQRSVAGRGSPSELDVDRTECLQRAGLVLLAALYIQLPPRHRPSHPSAPSNTSAASLCRLPRLLFHHYMSHCSVTSSSDS